LPRACLNQSRWP